MTLAEGSAKCDFRFRKVHRPGKGAVSPEAVTAEAFNPEFGCGSGLDFDFPV